MPRDNDKDNASSRGRRDRPSGGKGRSGAARGPEKKFAKRGFAGKIDGDKRPYAGKSDGAKPYAKKPYAGAGKPYAGKRDGDAARPRFNRDDRPARGADRSDSGPRKDFRPRDGGGEKRAYAPRGDSPRGERPSFKRDDRAPRADRGDTRPAGRTADRKFGEKRSYAPRGDRSFGDKTFSRGALDRGPRGPRKEFGDRADRGESKPWEKREARPGDDARHKSRPSRDGARHFDKPRFDKPRFDRPRDDRGGAERPRFSKPREDRPEHAAGGDRGPRKFDRPQGDRPRYDRPSGDRPRFDRPR
ncbi:MAG TPA: pseudouridine synthase, partial [Nitrobacter sp.]|nr:pseudouridine synthase [Nitrobacter sp.]